MRQSAPKPRLKHYQQQIQGKKKGVAGVEGEVKAKRKRGRRFERKRTLHISTRSSNRSIPILVSSIWPWQVFGDSFLIFVVIVCILLLPATTGNNHLLSLIACNLPFESTMQHTIIPHHLYFQCHCFGLMYYTNVRNEQWYYALT